MFLNANFIATRVAEHILAGGVTGSQKKGFLKTNKKKTCHVLYHFQTLLSLGRKSVEMMPEQQQMPSINYAVKSSKKKKGKRSCPLDDRET